MASIKQTLLFSVALILALSVEAWFRGQVTAQTRAAPSQIRIFSGSGTDPLTVGYGLTLEGTTLSVADSVIPQYMISQGPPSGDYRCVAGRDLLVDVADSKLYICPTAGVWAQVGQ